MSKGTLLDLILQYKKKGVLIDTNLALLYIVGTLDPLRIRDHSRTATFTEDDFQKLSKFIDAFDQKVVTPNILTEISNLLGKNEQLRGVLAGFIKWTEEKYIASEVVAETSAYNILGLTDAGIFEIAKDKYLVVTDDGMLEDILRRSGVDVVSLTLIRSI